MRKSDLHSLLQKPYTKGQGFGGEVGKTENLKSIWFVVPPPPTDKVPSGLKTSLLKEAHVVLSNLPKLESLSNLDRLVLSLLIKREALQSSRIEGTFSTIDQVLTPGELYNKKEKSARASIVGYAHALELAFQKAKKSGTKIFTSLLIKKLHKEMMSRDPEYRGKPGLLRSETGAYATIGGLGRPESSTYNPAPPNHVKRTLDESLSWIRDDILIEMSQAGMAPSLVVRLARGHWHFEAVHPFSDGNGRVGRMLMTLQMVCEGYAPLYLSGYIEANKSAYYEALKQAQMKLHEVPMVHFLCEAIIESWNESQKTKSALLELPSKWQAAGQFRGKSAAQNMLQGMLETPIFTEKHIQKKLKISHPAARRAIEQLQAANIIRERTGMTRNRVFAAEEVIELLARPFGEPPETALKKAKSLF